jgi:SAM-dependent methyltransferase
MESPGKNVESAINRADSYDVIDEYIAEIYDRTETQHDDVGFIKSLIGERPVKVLEPFCGNGRILIPLAEYGYEITGLDLSRQMLRSLEKKFRKLPQAVRTRITFRISDVIADEWPSGFDVVILGGNCFYELATPQEQEHCIKAAAAALVAGGAPLSR